MNYFTLTVINTLAQHNLGRVGGVLGGGDRQLLAQSEPNHGPAQLCRGRSSEGQRKDSGGRRPGGSGGAVDAEFCVFLFHRPLRGLRTALRIRSGPVPISQTGH